MHTEIKSLLYRSADLYNNRFEFILKKKSFTFDVRLYIIYHLFCEYMQIVM